MAIVKSLLEWATKELKERSKSPRLDSELLFSHVSGLSKVEIISAAYEEVEAKKEVLFKELVARRKQHEPVAYITGQREFFGIDFQVAPNVLIPRPESELLVELALDKAENFQRQVKILDLGTGSGCLAISIAKELQKSGRDFHITAIDIDPDALKIAKRNSERAKITEKINFINSHWFSELEEGKDKFDIIVSNPPYVSLSDIELSPETSFEPKNALFAGQDGLDCIKELLLNCHLYLNSPGYFYCEMGHQHRIPVEKLIDQFFNCLGKRISKVNFSTDLAGRDRVFSIEI